MIGKDIEITFDPQTMIAGKPDLARNRETMRHHNSPNLPGM